ATRAVVGTGCNSWISAMTESYGRWSNTRKPPGAHPGYHFRGIDEPAVRPFTWPSTVELAAAGRQLLARDRPVGGVDPRHRRELREDVSQVPLDGALGDRQAPGDLHVAARVGDQLQDLALPGRQRARAGAVDLTQAVPRDRQHHPLVVVVHAADRRDE